MTAAVSSTRSDEAIRILNDLCPRAVCELATMVTFSSDQSLKRIWTFGYLAKEVLITIGALSYVADEDTSMSAHTTLTPFFFELVKAAHSHTA